MKEVGHRIGEVLRGDLGPLAGSIPAALEFLDKEMARERMLLEGFIDSHHPVSGSRVGDSRFAQS